MRLIDADEVKELINGLDSLPWEEEVDDLVDRIPTVEAIPKEKLDEIVEKLEEASFEVIVDDGFDEYDYNSADCVLLSEAIEIVKGVMNERD